MKNFQKLLFSLLTMLVTIFPFGARAEMDYGGFLAGKTGYVFENALVSDSHPVVQGEVSATHSSGLYAKLWGSAGLTGDDGDEIDLVAGLSGESYRVELARYYFMASRSWMWGPSVHLYPGHGLDLAAQYLGDRTEDGYSVWTEYSSEDGLYGARLSHTKFAGHVTVIKGWYGWELAPNTVFSLTAYVPVSNPDDIGSNRLIAGIQYSF